MKCTVCQSEIDKDSNFCPNCGTKVVLNDINETESASHEKAENLCPKCSSNNIKCVKTDDLSMKKYWAFIFIIVILGVKVHTWVLNLAIIVGVIVNILVFLVNRAEKKQKDHKVKMKCNKCGHVFFIS